MKLGSCVAAAALLIGGIDITRNPIDFETSRDPASGPHHRHLLRLPTTPAPSPPPADLPILEPEERPILDLSSFRFPLVLMYHDIVATSSDLLAGSDVLDQTFRAEMRMLKERGYTTISLEELHEAMIGNSALPEKSVLITFDDGYIGNWKYAYPFLKAEGMKAAFFIHTNYVGTQTAKLHMNWEQLRAIDPDPLFEVMSHTLTHADLSSLVMDEVVKEVRDSRAMVERMLGGSHPYFAYPYGKHGLASLSVTRKYYDMAFVVGTPSVDRRLESAYEIPRLSMVKNQSVQDFGLSIQAYDEDPEINPLR